MHKINENTLGIDQVKFDVNLADSEVLVQINEWVLTNLSKVITQDNDELHASLMQGIT